jgi:DNA transposition AAA+ family ATPase
MIANEVKQRIVAAMIERRKNYGSDAKMAIALGINSAQLSRIKKGEYDGVLSDAKFITIARLLDVQIGNLPVWKTAKTYVYTYISTQLELHQSNSTSGMLCDMCDIGKTYTARCYVKEHANAVYIDCSQLHHYQQLIRTIAKEYGLGHTGKYTEVYADLVFYLQGITGSRPLVILDEFGDLSKGGIKEVKRLYNAVYGYCGFYMMGADGLRAKLQRGYAGKKEDYAELLSRSGVDDGRVGDNNLHFKKITPEGRDAMRDFVANEVRLIAAANGVSDAQKLLAKTGGSLRKLRTEVLKLTMING